MKRNIIIACLAAFTLATVCTSCRTRVVAISEYQGDDQPLGEWIKCSKCDGTGACKKCKGTGLDGTCSACKGTGVCASCNGQGGHR